MNIIRRLTGPAARFFRSFIPKYISNRVVLSFMEGLRLVERLRKDRFSTQHDVNRAVYVERIGLLEDQRRYRDLTYGRRDIARCGCEILAAYNALLDLDMLGDASLPDLIRAFSKDGMLAGGRFGTSPLSVRTFLTRQGLRTVLTSRESEFSRVADRSRGVILTFYNDKMDIFKQVHTVYISVDSHGWTVHNLYGNGRTDGPYASFDEVLREMNYGKIKGICLIGIM